MATTTTSFSPGVVVSTGVLYSNVVPSGYCSGSILLDASGCGLLGSAATYCVLGSTTTTFAGTSTIGWPFSLATTTTSFSPEVVVSTGVLYSNVVSSGYSPGVTLSFASGCFLAGFATTNCGVLSTTRTVAGTSTIVFPCGSSTSTTTFLSPVVVTSIGVVCPSGVLYLNVVPSG